VSTKQKIILIYLAALVVVVVMLDLHFAASQEVDFPLRVRVERQDAAIRQRTYQIQLTNARNNAPLSGATVLVFTQARDSQRSEILIVATETETRGVYRAMVPFSHDGDWFVHIGLNRPIATHVSFAEVIQRTNPGPPIPALEAEGEPVGEVTLRTLADGYAFITHLAATATLGLAIVFLFVASRDQSRVEMGALGTHLFWASIIVLLSTGICNYVYHTISEAPIPLTLNIAETWRQFALSSYGNIYAVILAAKHLAILALIGIGATVTFAWQPAREANLEERTQKKATATTLAVILGTVILLLGGALVYLHAISEH
jgi:hypothetical protein